MRIFFVPLSGMRQVPVHRVEKVVRGKAYVARFIFFE